MADWFSSFASQAMKMADDFADSLVSQANEAQEQIQREQAKLREEDEMKKVTLNTSTQLPWETTDESLQILSDALMDSILKLSLNELNFTTVPANSEEIVFAFSDFIATALHLLKLDANLAHVHSKVSPKMDEEQFWRNYYSRVIYLRAKCGIDGVAAQEASAQWNNAKIVFDPDYAQVLTRASVKPTLDSFDNPTNFERSGRKSPAGRAAGGSSNSKSNSSSNLFTTHGEANKLSDPLRDSVDLDDLDELDFTSGGASAGAMGSGKQQGGEAGDEDGEGEEEEDVDLGDLDLADLDDEMDLLRELREMEEEEEAEQQQNKQQQQQQQQQQQGKNKESNNQNQKGAREVGELGSYEDVGKSDCHSSSSVISASNAELEAQIAAELANLSDDDEDL